MYRSNLFYSFLFATFISAFCLKTTLLNGQKKNQWIGITPAELIPTATPLGSLKGRSFHNAQPAVPVPENPAKELPPSNLSDAEEKAAMETMQREKMEPSPPFTEFHSNLGRQAIVEKIPEQRKNWIGLTPNQLHPNAIPLGILQSKTYQKLNASMPVSTSPQVNPTAEQNAEVKPLEFSLFASTRPYFSNNVLRTKEDEVKSAVLENTIGTSLATKPIESGQYLVLVPRLDFLMQWANYNEGSVSDLLDYQFGMVKGTLDFYLPLDFRISTGLEYDFLHSQFSGDKIFDAVAPSFAVQKIWGINETAFLMLDGLLKYSSTKRVITFPTDDIFPDDGDNIQVGLNLNFMKSFGPDGQFTIMPGLGINRTEYLKNNQDGRVDMIYFAGLSGIWQPLQWLSLQTFGNFSTMRTNSKGKEILGKSSKFNAWDLGASVTASHTF